MPVQPIRLQKFMADAGICSRRKAEELISSGHVKINGHPAELGSKVDPRRDIVTLRGKRISIPESNSLYIMLNKPRGYVTTLSDEMDRKCVADLLTGIRERVYPVGRLDRTSEGLLLITNDGEFANIMTHPSSHITKTYRVTIRPGITEDQLNKMREGIVIDGRKTAPATVDIIERNEERTVIRIILGEGRNRQIRKMCEALNIEVARLKRTAVGNVKLGTLPPGKWRFLTKQELKELGVKTTN